MNRSTPGFPVHHQLWEFTQTRVHWVGDAIQPSHPLSSPSPPALNLSQHQGLFKWVRSLHQSIGVSASASVLPLNTQDWSPYLNSYWCAHPAVFWLIKKEDILTYSFIKWFYKYLLRIYYSLSSSFILPTSVTSSKHYYSASPLTIVNSPAIHI